MLTRWGTAALLAALMSVARVGAAPHQEATHNFAWKLPHDRAAAYEVYELPAGTKQGNFWLLSCEVEGRVGATHGSELPYRYIFRLPKDKVRVGEEWKVKDTAFGDLPVVQGVGPVEVAGAYRLMRIKKTTVADEFKAAHRGVKAKGEPVELALIEGRLQVSRCNWVDGKVVVAEKTPSATLMTLTAVRLSDNAIVGGRYQWSGRMESYTGKLSNPAVTKATESAELVLREPLVELTKAGLKNRIDRAVERGVAWLRTQQAKDGSIWDRAGYPVGTAQGIGATGMATMALLHSGVRLDDPAVQAGFQYIQTRKVAQSYDLALLLMAIEAKYLPLGSYDEIEKFSEDKAREEIARKITRADKDAASAAVRDLLATQDKSGLFGYAGGAGYPNLSSTQYAILGLKSASRMGVTVDASVWRKPLEYLSVAMVDHGKQIRLRVEMRGQETVEREGKVVGWGYQHPRYPMATGTMTAAALSTIAICRSELLRAKEWGEKDEAKIAPLEWGSLGWLQENYAVRAATPEGCGYAAAMPYYYLYGLERAFILARVQGLGGHDWYHEGAATLLSWQREDGRWEGPHGVPVVDTAFALLFLKRATVPVETPAAVPSVDPKK